MSMQTERRCSSRTRSQPTTPSVTTKTDEPAKITAQVRPNRDLNRLTAQPRRIPALTTSRTFGQRSPIVNVDIQGFLAKCMDTNQWKYYTDEEKRDIIASLPQPRQHRIQRDLTSPQSEQGLDDSLPQRPPLNADFCTTDLYMKRAVARFKRDLADGYYEKSWQEKASKAHEERLEGKFDGYLQQHAEEVFLEEDGDAESAIDELAEESEDGEYTENTRKNGKTRKQ